MASEIRKPDIFTLIDIKKFETLNAKIKLVENSRRNKNHDYAIGVLDGRELILEELELLLLSGISEVTTLEAIDKLQKDGKL